MRERQLVREMYWQGRAWNLLKAHCRATLNSPLEVLRLYRNRTGCEMRTAVARVVKIIRHAEEVSRRVRKPCDLDSARHYWDAYGGR